MQRVPKVVSKKGVKKIGQITSQCLPMSVTLSGYGYN